MVVPVMFTWSNSPWVGPELPCGGPWPSIMGLIDPGAAPSFVTAFNDLRSPGPPYVPHPMDSPSLRASVRPIASVLVLTLMHASAAAQERTPVDTVDLLAELITVEDGLPQGMVQCMLQDKEGYLWFGTRGGLARSDGYGFTVFQHDDADSTSISSNIIRAMAEDAAGFIWVGMESGEVDRFDPRTTRFVHVVDDPDVRAGLWPEIRAIIPDHRGNIWIHSAKEGVRVVKPVSIGERPFIQLPHVAYPDIPWPDRIDHLSATNDGSLWLAHGDSMMVVDRHIRHVVRRWHIGGAPVDLYERGELIMACPDGDAPGLWFVRAHELLHFTLSGNPSRHPLDASAAISSMRAMQGHVWLSKGACHRIRTSDGRREEVRFTEIHGKRLKPEQVVSSWLEDRSGNIWAGTNGYGVLKVTRVRQRFQRMPDVAVLYKASSSGDLVLASNDRGHRMDASGRITPDHVTYDLRAHGLIPTPNIRVCDAAQRSWVSAAASWDEEPTLTVVHPSGRISIPSIVPPDLSTRNLFPGTGDEAWALACMRTGDRAGITDVLCFDTRTERLVRRYAFPYPHHAWSDITGFAIGPEGGAPMTPTIASKVLKLFTHRSRAIGTTDFQLTEREVEILKLLVDGYSYKMIATKCAISYATVNTHVSRIYQELQVKERGQRGERGDTRRTGVSLVPRHGPAPCSEPGVLSRCPCCATRSCKVLLVGSSREHASVHPGRSLGRQCPLARPSTR